MRKKVFQENSKVISNVRESGNYFKITLGLFRIPVLVRPGQFLEVKVLEGVEPLLRRPLSVHRLSSSKVEILYEVLGEGTKILSQKKPGEYLDVIGPLGNGFTYPTTDNRQLTTILVAGGMGVAPLAFLAERLVHSSKFKVKRKVIVLLGARTKNQILCEREFKQLGCEVKISTDDGSRGFNGRVTELFKDLLRRTTYDVRRTTIYACGPSPMLKELAKLARQYNIPAQVSLEAHMACGIGACMGCVVKLRTKNQEPRTNFEYKRVCKDGPVFDSNELIW